MPVWQRTLYHNLSRRGGAVRVGYRTIKVNARLFALTH